MPEPEDGPDIVLQPEATCSPRRPNATETMSFVAGLYLSLCPISGQKKRQLQPPKHVMKKSQSFITSRKTSLGNCHNRPLWCRCIGEARRSPQAGASAAAAAPEPADRPVSRKPLPTNKATKSVKLKGATTPSPELRRLKCIQIYARLIQRA